MKLLIMFFSLTKSSFLFVHTSYLSSLARLHSTIHPHTSLTPLVVVLNYSMMLWNCQKLNSSNSVLKPLFQGFLMCQKLRMHVTFWYFRHLGSPDQLKISIGLIWDNWRKMEEMHQHRPLRILFDTLTPPLYSRTLPIRESRTSLDT